MDGIKKMREKKGITQQQLALILGVKQSTVGMWEVNKRKPRAIILPEIAKTLSCTITDLY